METRERCVAGALIALFVLTDGCRPTSARQPGGSVPAPSGPPSGAVELGLSAEMRGSAPACAFVSIGFDRRGWPTSDSYKDFDTLTRWQADAFRGAAPPGSSPRMYTQPGTTFFALFDGASGDVVLARCRQTVAAYLPKAPRMPGSTMGPDGKLEIPSATHVQTPCRPCDDRR